MNKKQKFLLISLLTSLIFMVVIFQNCSQNNGGNLTDPDFSSLLNGDGNGTGGGTNTTPTPTIVFSTSSTCSPSVTTFPAASTTTIYVCVQNVGSGVGYQLYDNYNLVDSSNIPSTRWTQNNGWYVQSYAKSSLYNSNSGFYASVMVTLSYQGTSVAGATFYIQ